MIGDIVRIHGRMFTVVSVDLAGRARLVDDEGNSLWRNL